MESDRLLLTPLLEQQWGASRLKRLRQIGETAARLHMSAYLVGGCVRDLFQQRLSQDIDLAVEGDVRVLAEACKAWIPEVHYRYHPQFGTATLQDEAGLTLDMARCRVEHYPAPAALPEVAPSDIGADLKRRDFTINAMAMAVLPSQFGKLLDPFGGRHDLDNSCLRILHSRSFLDDPTRILRGLRFASRFHLDPAPATRTALRQALEQRIFTRLSGARLWRELKYLLELAESGILPTALNLLNDWKLWFLFRPAPADVSALIALVQQAREEILWFRSQFPDELLHSWVTSLILLWTDTPMAETRQHLMDWPVPDARSLMHDFRLLPDLADAVAAAKHPSDHARIWQGLSIGGILAGVVANHGNTALRHSAHRYLLEQRAISAPLNGKELQHLGLKPGPGLGKTLKILHDARLNGEISDKESAQKWLIKQGILPPKPA